MTISELNDIIYENYGDDSVYVSKDVYPEVEELYLMSPAIFDKRAVADFYQKFDYVGVRNALAIASNMTDFKNKVFDSIFVSDTNVKVTLTPSQKYYLKQLGWKNLDFIK